MAAARPRDGEQAVGRGAGGLGGPIRQRSLPADFGLSRRLGPRGFHVAALQRERHPRRGVHYSASERRLTQTGCPRPFRANPAKPRRVIPYAMRHARLDVLERTAWNAHRGEYGRTPVSAELRWRGALAQRRSPNPRLRPACGRKQTRSRWNMRSIRSPESRSSSSAAKSRRNRRRPSCRSS